jgi:hypothetical protein
MLSWWHRDVIAAGKLPLMLSFVSFVVTFASTRTITRPSQPNPPRPDKIKILRPNEQAYPPPYRPLLATQASAPCSADAAR